MDNIVEAKNELLEHINYMKHTGTFAFTREDWRLISVSVEVCQALEELSEAKDNGTV